MEARRRGVLRRAWLAPLLGCLACAHAPERVAPAVPGLTLTTSPRRVWKDGQGAWERFLFRLVVRAPAGAAAEPRGATVELSARDQPVKTLHYGAAELAALRGHASTAYSADFDARYELAFAFEEPARLEVDAARVTLEVDGGQATLRIPIGVYAQKTRLRFPLAGDFMVVTGPGTVDGGHLERSQLYALDVVGLGPRLELLRGDGTQNTDFVGYGRDVLAPAGGVIVYARGDVPDNPASGNQDFAALLALPEPPWGVAGNCVVIDHEDGEYSLLAHMQPGSVRVRRGQRVAPGEVLGRLGNSGATTGPHLHFHLMDGPALLGSDGLPARFENTCEPSPRLGKYCDAK
jgi:murein DD-endopeptidase MepM/ murein hydrolase activator NlpD